MLKIITNPNPILREKSQVVSNVFNTEIQELVSQMIETMLAKDGVGLAAPQIGKNICLTVINHKDNVLVIFNPQITKKSWLKEWDEEGCLSVPGKFGEVKRHRKMKINFTDKEGQKQVLEAKGLLARVIQHEIDHLNGILFIDKAKNLQSHG